MMEEKSIHAKKLEEQKKIEFVTSSLPA